MASLINNCSVFNSYTIQRRNKVALGQLTSNPALGAVEDNMHRFLAKLKSLPLSFWRGLIVVVALIWLCRSLATLFWVVFPVPDAPKLIICKG